MSKKLPSISKLPIVKKINHNKEVFYSFAKEDEQNIYPSFVRENSTLSKDKTEVILDKINSVFHSTHHSFQVPVKITTNNKIYETKLAGVVDDKLLTMDDDEIMIADILKFDILNTLDR